MTDGTPTADPRTRTRKLAAEAIGTFALVFAGTGAIVVDDVSGGLVSHAGGALTFGLVVMVYAVGEISGAHLNPAVTLDFWTARRLDGRAVLPYVAAQCAGAVQASSLLRVLFLAHPPIGGTVGFGALVGGPVSGASMNPARSLGPALLSGHLDHLWLHLMAPVAGAYLAVHACRCVREPGCCRG
jgi:aquaporin Z